MTRLSSDKALHALEQLNGNRELLGLDGFRMVEDGFEASLDLILDLSVTDGANQTHSERVAEAKDFILAKSAPDVVWEIWTA
jgi:hypothetical protein